MSVVGVDSLAALTFFFLLAMSLTLDRFFFNALKASRAIGHMTGGRVFNTTRTTEDDRLDKVPYIIVTFDSLTNDLDALTKDDMESEEDNVTVSLICVAENRKRLGELTVAARKAVLNWLRADRDEIEISSWQFSAGSVQCDVDKPCFYQTLTYNCIADTNINL